MVMISDKVIEMATKNETDAKRERAKMLRKRFGKIKNIKEETLGKVNQYSTDWLDNHKVKNIYVYTFILFITNSLYFRNSVNSSENMKMSFLNM